MEDPKSKKRKEMKLKGNEIDNRTDKKFFE